MSRTDQFIAIGVVASALVTFGTAHFIADWPVVYEFVFSVALTLLVMYLLGRAFGVPVRRRSVRDEDERVRRGPTPPRASL
jgi:hypothetical protein